MLPLSCQLDLCYGPHRRLIPLVASNLVDREIFVQKLPEERLSNIHDTGIGM